MIVCLNKQEMDNIYNNLANSRFNNRISFPSAEEQQLQTRPLSLVREHPLEACGRWIQRSHEHSEPSLPKSP